MPKKFEEQPPSDPALQENEQLEIIGTADPYPTVLSAVVELMEAARRAAARSVNAIIDPM